MTGYQLSHVDTTEEILQSDIAPGISHEGWRRFRINYRNEMGHSNIEGTIYFPPHVKDPLLILSYLENALDPNGPLPEGINFD